MKAAIYIRVSTPKKTQAKEDEVSKYVQNPEVQLLPLRKLCEARGFEVVEVYQDRMTGSRNDRPGYNKLWIDAKKGKFNIVLVWRFDRFARSTKELLTSLDEFRSRRIDFYSMTESMDTSTPMGKMVFTFLAAIAEFERALIIERINSGIAYAKEKGTKSGKAIGRPKKIVRRDVIKEMAASGKSQREIATEMGVSQATVNRIVGDSKPPRSSPRAMGFFEGVEGPTIDPS